MNQQEERKICFDVDQNKQKINYLIKKNQENTTSQTELNQKIETTTTEINQKITNAQQDIAALETAVENLQNSSGSDEEKVELQSYDCYRTKDRLYRDIFWLPRPIGFVAESGKAFKLRIKFDAVSTFETQITSTVKATLDGEEIYSSTEQIAAGGTQAVDFEYIITSEKTGHKLIIELRNTETAQRRSNCCIPDLLTVELWGTNVQFITRNNDFAVLPAGNNVVLTTTVYDNPQALFSMQAADENLSLEESAFKFLRTNDYRDYNQVLPLIDVSFDQNGNMTYSTKPSLFVHNVQTDDTKTRIAYYQNVDGNNSKAINPSGVPFLDAMLSKSILTNSNNVPVSTPIPEIVGLLNDGSIVKLNKGTLMSFVLQRDVDRYTNIDVCGVARLDNYDDKTMYYGVATRQDGISYFWSSKASQIQFSKVFLGFGTHCNAYLLANNQIVAFLRVGKNIKKVTLELDGSKELFYHVVSTEMIPNCQEYWLAPNGNHFERVGNKIKYFIGQSQTPAKTLTVF